MSLICNSSLVVVVFRSSVFWAFSTNRGLITVPGKRHYTDNGANDLVYVGAAVM